MGVVFGGVPNLPIFEISRKSTPLYLLTQITKLGSEVMTIRVVMFFFFWLILALIILQLKIISLCARCIREAPSAIRCASPPRGVRRTKTGYLRWVGECVWDRCKVRMSRGDITGLFLRDRVILGERKGRGVLGVKGDENTWRCVRRS